MQLGSRLINNFTCQNMITLILTIIRDVQKTRAYYMNGSIPLYWPWAVVKASEGLMKRTE